MTTPSMSGTGSYLALPALTNTHHELRLDVEFKPLAPDGILVFSGGQSGPVEDFVSLAMVGGHLEFRYELGSGEHCRQMKMGIGTTPCAPRRREGVNSEVRPTGVPVLRCFSLCDWKQVPGSLRFLWDTLDRKEVPHLLKFQEGVGQGSDHPCANPAGHPPQGWPFCGAPSHWPWAAGTTCPQSVSTRTAACG